MSRLLGVVYISKATKDFELQELFDLTAKASAKNKEQRITGYLYFEKGNFLQYIEGDTNVVAQLMKDIEQDTRHEVIKVLKNEHLQAKKFPSWHMQYITREMLSQITMENLIIDRLNYIKKIDEIPNVHIDGAEKEAPVWRMIDELSKYRFEMARH